jgi:hypothetical protein
VPQTVEIRGYGTYDFPDDWSDDQIRQTVRDRIAQRDRAKTTYGPIADVGLGAVRGFAGTLGSGAAGLADLFGAEETGRTIREATDIQRPFGYAAPGSTAANIGETLGGAGAFLGTTGAAALAAPVVGAGAGLGALLAGATLGAGTGVEEQRQRREQAELEGRPIDERSRLMSALGGAAIGATEALPFGRLATRTIAPLRRALGPASEAGLEAAQKLTKPSLWKAVGAQAAEEAAQEAFSQTAQGVLEKQLYSPDRDVFAGAGEAALGGAGIGALLELGLRGPGRVAARRRYQAALEGGATEQQAVQAAIQPAAETKDLQHPQDLQDLDEDSIVGILGADEPTEAPEPARAESPVAQVAPVEAEPVTAAPSPVAVPEAPIEAPRVSIHVPGDDTTGFSIQGVETNLNKPPGSPDELVALTPEVVTGEPAVSWDTAVKPTVNVGGVWTEDPTTKKIIWAAEQELINRGRITREDIPGLRRAAGEKLQYGYEHATAYANTLQDYLNKPEQTSTNLNKPPEPSKAGEPPPVEVPVEAVPESTPPPVRRSLASAFWDENPHVAPDDLSRFVQTVQGGVPVRKAIDQVFGDRALDARPVLERMGVIERTVGPKATFELGFDPNDYDIPAPTNKTNKLQVPEGPQLPAQEKQQSVVPPPQVASEISEISAGDWRTQTLGTLKESLGKMKLDQRVGVELADQVLTKAGEQAEGVFDPNANVVRLSMEMANRRSLKDRQQHLKQVLGHEAIHIAQPLFTTKEWSVMAREAKKRGHLQTAEELYKEQPGYSPDLAVEESIANLFRDKAEGSALPSNMNSLYNRFVDYLTRFGNTLRGQGFQTADDVFARLRSGEVGARDTAIVQSETAKLQPGAATGQPRYALPRPAPPPTESQRVIDAAKLIREGQPVDAKAFTHPADLDYAQRLAKDSKVDLDQMRKINPDELFNIGKLDLNDRTKEHLRNEVRLLAMTEGFDPKKRVSFDQVRREANALIGQHVPLDVKALKSGETLHPSVRLAMAKLVRQAQAQIVRTTDALTKLSAAGKLTNDQQLAEQHRIDVLRAERDRLLNTLIPARTQDGRNLVAHRIEVQSSFDPVYWNALMKRKLNLPPNVNPPPEIMEPLNTALSKGQAAKDAFDEAAQDEAADPTPAKKAKRAKAEKDLVDAKKAVAAVAQKFERTKPLEAALSMWKAALLTGVPTQIANFTSNASFALLEKISSMPAAWVDTALSYTKLGDGRRTVLNQLGSAGAWDRAWVGTMAGMRESGQILKAAAKGAPVAGAQDALGRIEVSRSFNLGGGNAFVRGVENTVNGVFDVQMAADRPFFRAAEAAAAHEVSQLAARNGKLPPGVTTAEELEQRMARQRELGNKGPELETLNNEVKAIAEFTTFANENFGSRGFQSFKRGMEQTGDAGKAAAFLAEGVVPFVKVPVNVFKAIIEYSPAGVALGSARIAADAIFKKSMDAKAQRMYSQLIGRGLVGSALMYLGYKAAEAGLMTGFRDEQDTAGRTADAAAGHPQGALYIGNNKWAQVGRISPGGNLLVIGASLYREGNRPLKDVSKRLGNLGAAAAQSVMEMPFMMGAENLLDAVKNPGEGRYLQRQLGTVVPSIVRRGAAALDPYQREIKGQGVLAGVKAGLPFIRETLPIRHEVLGRPLPEAGIGWLGRFADPFRTVEERQDPVSQEILRTQFELGVPQVKKGEERPTYLLRSRLAGELYRQKLADVIQSSEYREATDDVKREMLKDAKEAGGRDLSKLTTYNPEYKEAATEGERRLQLERYLAETRAQAQ